MTVKSGSTCFHCHRKFLLQLFFVLLLIFYASNYYFGHSTVKANLLSTHERRGVLIAEIDGKNNSRNNLSAEKIKQSNGQYKSVQSSFDISPNNSIPRRLSPIEKQRKYFLDDQKVSGNSKISFTQLFVNFLDIELDVPLYHVEFFLNHPQLCPNKGANVTLIMTVSTAVDHGEARSAIREAWGGYARERGAKLLFFVGVSERSELNDRVTLEDRKFQDIIQSNFLDTYNNLTLKMVSMFKWVSEFCSDVKYMLKVDDDVFVNAEKLLALTSKIITPKSVMGLVYENTDPIRDTHYKNYVPYSAYPFSKYPDYITRPLYLVSSDSIKLLYDATIKIVHATLIPFYQNEDVYVTGFAAEMTGIKRINLEGVYSSAQEITSCNFQFLLSSHSHTPQYIREKWMSLKSSNFTCNQ